MPSRAYFGVYYKLMQSIKEIVIISPYRGSERTYEMVRQQIQERWGKECAETFNPRTDAMPISSWMMHGFVVKKGQKALKSITYLDVKDKDDNEVRKVRRTVNLFHKRQVERPI